MKKLILLIFVISLLILTGCKSEQMVGGPCNYETIKGICSFTANNTFIFEPIQNTKIENKLYNTYVANQTISRGIEGSIGDVLNCNVQLITKGTCTPVIFLASSKQQTTIDNRCNWNAGLCDMEIASGYYFNLTTNKCEYFNIGSGCSPTPFKTLEECESICP